MDEDQSSDLEALEGILSDPSAEPIKLSYGLLKLITENFTNEIGRGGFGVVYKGNLQNGVIAVKKISNAHNISDKQFMNEIKCLKGPNHKNIVRFLGYCAETQEVMLPFDGTFVMAGEPNRLLCFDYVQNGNIREYLEQELPDGNDQWHIRFQIIKGVCQGLHYLHEKRISHLDLKPENVMLDDCMVPKITDFGMSRFLAKGKSIIVTRNIRGTFGYIAPEMINKGHISFKSDIYALGIIIIKLLTGRNIIDFDNWHESIDLDRPGVTSCIEIARNCIEFDQDHRPTIGNIIIELNEIEGMIQELTHGTAGTSTDQISRMVFPGTELLDVYPRKLSFPFQPNQQQPEMQCHLSIINKTDGDVGFFVLPPNLGDRIEIRSLNGILTPMSSNVLTLTMLMSKEDDEPPFDTEEVLILMLTMRSSDDARELMKTSVNEEGELNMSTDNLYEQVEILGGEIHRAMLKAIIIFSEHDTRTPTFVDTTYEVGGNISTEVHPTKPWILVSGRSCVWIWNWRTMATMDIKKFHISLMGGPAKFIARKQWVIFSLFTGEAETYIYVYTYHAWKEPSKVVKIKLNRLYSIEVHPTRPFVLLLEAGYAGRMVKLLDWDQNWSCTREWDTLEVGCTLLGVPFREWHKMVIQLSFNPADANTFVTVCQFKRVKVWKFDSSMPIATMEGLKGTSRLKNILTCKPDQHLVAAISAPIVHIWDMQNGKRVHTLSALPGGPSSDDEIVAVACHRTRAVLVTASNHGYLHVWDSTNYRLKKEYVNLGRGPKDIAFLGSTRIMISNRDGIKMMDIDT